MQSLSHSYYLASIYLRKNSVRHITLYFRTTVRDKHNLGNLQADPLMERHLETIHLKGRFSHWQYLKPEKQRTLQNRSITLQQKNPEDVCSLHQAPKKKGRYVLVHSMGNFAHCFFINEAESTLMKTQTVSS